MSAILNFLPITLTSSLLVSLRGQVVEEQGGSEWTVRGIKGEHRTMTKCQKRSVNDKRIF
jgi:hypothetical protein